MNLLLTDIERKRFSEWLQLQISTSEGIEEQMLKLNVPNAVSVRERQERTACLIVLRMIESAEVMSIGADSERP